MYNKFVLGLPLYRQEADLICNDVPVSRQTMANWGIRFALDLFGPLYDYLTFLLKLCRYNQCDETVLPAMMPWSEEYKEYEFMKKQEFIRGSSEHEPVQAPKTPGKKDRKDQA